MSSLDRLYAELITASGVHRIRDTRLELVAMDRALEARYTVGTEGSLGIPHPTAQLIARTYPHRAHTPHGVHENAVWSYRDDWQADFVPRVVEAWMNSEAHRDNLLRVTDTHWGLGYHVEPPTGSQTNSRIYVIAVLSEALRDIAPGSVVMQPGDHVGRQRTASGRFIAAAKVHLDSATTYEYDVRQYIPQQGPHYHLVSGPLKHYWVKTKKATEL